MNDIDLLKKNIYSDISRLVLQIKNCHSKTSYNILISDFIVLHQLADLFEIENTPDIDNFSFKTYDIDELKLLKKSLSKYKKSYQDNYLLSKNYLQILDSSNIGSIDLKNSDYKINKKLTIKENIDIIADFFDKFDKKTFDFFKDLSKQNRVAYRNIKMGESIDYGSSYFGYNSFSPYILIETPENIITSTTLVHEIGHLADYQKDENTSNKQRINKSNNNCLEITSHFYELAFYDFLEQNNICSEDIYNIKLNYFEQVFDNVYDLNLLLKKNISNIEQLYDNYESLKDNFTYTYGKVLALHFYDIYKKDNKSGIEQLNNFMTINSVKEHKSSSDILKDTPFSKKEILSGKVLKKNLKRLKSK